MVTLREVATEHFCGRPGMARQVTIGEKDRHVAQMFTAWADAALTTASLRALQRRTTKLEKAQTPKRSLIAVWYGSAYKFVDATYLDIERVKLSDDFYDILDALRGWEQLDAR